MKKRRNDQTTVVVDSKDYKILIVDDSRVQQEILKELVISLGYKAVLADDGKSGLTQIDKEKPSLVLLDLLMPVMDGHEMLGILKSSPSLSDIPVIIISSVEDLESTIECIEKGADDYLHKPINLKILKARISSCLKKKRRWEKQDQLRLQLSNSTQIIDNQNKDLCKAKSMLSKYSEVRTHELGNLLQTIIGSGELLLNLYQVGQVITEENIDFIKTISQNARLMQDILKHSFDDHSMVAEKLEMTISFFDINQLVLDFLEPIRVLASQKRITINTSFSKESPKALGDPVRITQVLYNLLTNAVKFSDIGTSILVSTNRVAGGEVVRIEIQDQGPGIRESERGHLFKLFAKLSNKPTANESNEGLGLAISKKLIEAQNGTIGVKFPPKKNGSIFWFELPIC